LLSPKTIQIIKSTVPVLAVKGNDITTVFYKNLFEDYPELLNIFNHANQSQGRQQTALANTVYAAALHIEKLEAILPVVKQIAEKHRSLGVKPEHYPIVGKYLLAAIKEVLEEGATDEILAAWGEAYGIISQVFIGVETKMYKEAAENQGGWDGFKTFTVVKKVKESSHITSFYLSPNDKAVLPVYKAGQFVTVQLRIPGELFMLNRQYSLSNASGNEFLRISVKREVIQTPVGKVSNYLHDHIEVGNEISLSAPAGDFVIDQDQDGPIYFISGGVGITPLLSMLEEEANKGVDRDLYFIHASKDEASHAFHMEIMDHLKKIPSAKSYTIYEDNQSGSPIANWTGYLTKEKLQEIVTENGTFYICGPILFMESIVSSLVLLGIKNENIHYEFFGPAIPLAEKETVKNS
jgi:nitric oxide dioxygenase